MKIIIISGMFHGGCASREVITIDKELLRYKPRHKLKATKKHKDKTKYERKRKHKKSF
jgi:hypothetical protein